MTGEQKRRMRCEYVHVAWLHELRGFGFCFVASVPLVTCHEFVKYLLLLLLLSSIIRCADVNRRGNTQNRQMTSRLLACLAQSYTGV